jgi:3-hydroxyacyl-CoA dehydrogenase
MGHGIAQTIAQKGIKVTAVESKPEALKAGMDRFDIYSSRQVFQCSYSWLIK